MHSIRTRFLTTAIISTCLALALSAWIFTELFSQSYLRRVDLELTELINQLAGSIEFDANGLIRPPAPTSDRRFEKAYSGAYWQIEDSKNNRRLRSVSLWDYVIPLPNDIHELGSIHRYSLPGPDNSTLIVQERQLLFTTPTNLVTVRIAVALDSKSVEHAIKMFALDLIPFMLGLAVILVATSAAQLTYGLKPISSLREGLQKIHNRQSRRLHGQYPTELLGMVQVINQLLETQEKSLENARKHASNLAHGLKTPLTTLLNDARKLHQHGETDLADEIEAVALTMQNHVNGELTRSRIVNSPQQRQSNANIAQVTDEIIRTLKRAPRDTPLTWKKSIAGNLTVGVDPHDLRELLGNLLENAWKWAHSEISISAANSTDGIVIDIKDDGQGVASDHIGHIMKRGIRYDSKVPGTGLGLSIVAEIVNVYSLGFELKNRDPHGLHIRVVFPQA
ncbi:MAG: HAMP domain-containing histidine kinase [Gammaproteobacteria bacterium]|nr:HAMP domain-containing histidine kinase [Gammaproteobacteria bacterium]